jgi:hypothetical protein
MAKKASNIDIYKEVLGIIENPQNNDGYSHHRDFIKTFGISQSFSSHIVRSLRVMKCGVMTIGGKGIISAKKASIEDCLVYGRSLMSENNSNKIRSLDYIANLPTGQSTVVRMLRSNMHALGESFINLKTPIADITGAIRSLRATKQ